MEPGAWWPSNNDEHYVQSNKQQRRTLCQSNKQQR